MPCVRLLTATRLVLWGTKERSAQTLFMVHKRVSVAVKIYSYLELQISHVDTGVSLLKHCNRGNNGVLERQHSLNDTSLKVNLLANCTNSSLARDRANLPCRTRPPSGRY